MIIRLIAGLPGSGKTHMLEAYRAEYSELGIKFFVVDDIVDLAFLPKSFDQLFISDVNFCRPMVRESAERKLCAMYPDATITWTFFENDPVQCKINAAARNDGRNVIPDINALTVAYSIPDGVITIPVFRP